MSTPYPHYIVKVRLPDDVAGYLNVNYDRGYELKSITPMGGNGVAFVVMEFCSGERRASYERREQTCPPYVLRD